LLVEGDPLVPSQWEYFGSRDFIFCRTSTNTCFNPLLAPEGYYGLCAELLCYEDDYVWKQPKTLLNSVIQNLIHANLVRNFNSIIDVRFEWVKNTYPIYKIDYLKQLDIYKKKIAGMKNVLACGRTGGFWYNNMDHSVRSSLDIAKKFDPEKPSQSGQPASGVWRGDF
jgi:protoporphyrinogen oxidase